MSRLIPQRTHLDPHATHRSRTSAIPCLVVVVMTLVLVMLVSLSIWEFVRLRQHLQAANIQLQAAQMLRYRDRFNFLVNSAEEWSLRPKISSRRLGQALDAAAKAHVDEGPVADRIRLLPAPVVLPVGASARLVRSRVNPPMIELELSVTADDKPITNLSAADFEVYDSNREVKHLAVAKANAPLAEHYVAILVDRSGSVAGDRLTAMKATLDRFIASAGSEARMKLLTFGASVTSETPWTNDSVLLRETVQRIMASGGTALRTGVSEAVAALTATNGKRTLILFTDGKDTVGGVELPALVTLCRTNRIAVHCVGFAAGDIDRAFVETLAAQTGGTFSLVSAPDDLTRAMTTISRELSAPVYRLAILDPDESLSEMTVTIGADRSLSVAVDVRRRTTSHPGTGSGNSVSPNATRVSQIVK